MPAIKVGTTGATPTSATTGDFYYDFELERWFRWNGAAYVDEGNPPIGDDAIPRNHKHAYPDLVGTMGGPAYNVVTKSSGYAAAAGDDVILCNAVIGGFTITLPTAVGRKGKWYEIKKIDASANVITIDPAGVETIDGLVTDTLDIEGEAMLVISDGANWKVI